MYAATMISKTFVGTYDEIVAKCDEFESKGWHPDVSLLNDYDVPKDNSRYIAFFGIDKEIGYEGRELYITRWCDETYENI